MSTSHTEVALANDIVVLALWMTVNIDTSSPVHLPWADAVFRYIVGLMPVSTELVNSMPLDPQTMPHYLQARRRGRTLAEAYKCGYQISRPRSGADMLPGPQPAQFPCSRWQHSMSTRGTWSSRLTLLATVA